MTEEWEKIKPVKAVTDLRAESGLPEFSFLLILTPDRLEESEYGDRLIEKDPKTGNLISSHSCLLRSNRLSILNSPKIFYRNRGLNFIRSDTKSGCGTKNIIHIMNDVTVWKFFSNRRNRCSHMKPTNCGTF